MTEEVKLAIKHGLKITKIYSIWHWDKIEQYNEEKKSGGLITEYVNTFLKIKQETKVFLLVNFFLIQCVVDIVYKLIN